MDVLVVILYNAVVWPLLVYNLGQLSLLVSYLWAVRMEKPDPAPDVDDAPAAWPMVTVQLPVYNERYVAERLIDAVAQLDYPADKLQIQVLDDSTDDTTLLIARRVSHYQRRGQLLRLEHVRRTVRTGYKAGALAHGLTTATGTLIAVFDADFVPDPAFLHQTVPHFADPGVGLVQTRWTHLNRDYSLLTQLQGFGLDAHFFVEQRGRTAAGLLINFNGTGGIWRKTTILDAGGWSSHTLTEDLDLSYRAQLRGWRFMYREDIGSPGELPLTMAALRSQQYRWMKGAAECVRKLARPLLTARNVSPSAKLHGLAHLLSSSMFGLLLGLSVLSVPVLAVQIRHPDWPLAPGFLHGIPVNLLISLGLYGVPFARVRAENGQRWNGFRFVWLFGLYAALMLGLSLHNTLAVVAGYRGRQTPFVRTPKFNLGATRSDWRTNVYLPRRVPGIVWAEGALLLYFLTGIGLGLASHRYGMLPFHALLVIGYGLVVGYSLHQTRPAGPESLSASDNPAADSNGTDTTAANNIAARKQPVPTDNAWTGSPADGSV